ncbi:MAG: hypothetical protein J0I12_33935 [Candidatus Eremiobacteraeota bacterium]|nr:hypothetical protein [Candidatus Eremiobacteraeota bacterium]
MRALKSSLFSLALLSSAPADPGQLLTFPVGPGRPPSVSGSIDYRLQYDKEKFFVYRPSTYTNSETWGLIVYISPGDNCQGVPAGWDGVLKANKLLFIAPQGAGNGCEMRRRLGLGVMAALEMTQTHKIDPERIYAAGLSGGARTAGQLGFHQSDLFRGTIQNCGADFYKPVPVVKANNFTDSNGNRNYGVFKAGTREIDIARRNGKFVFITGPGDFRYGNINDIYEGGYKPDGFTCKLIDVPGMGHEDCKPSALQQALDFLKT